MINCGMTSFHLVKERHLSQFRFILRQDHSTFLAKNHGQLALKRRNTLQCPKTLDFGAEIMVMSGPIVPE